ncbi:hypothetical protein [Gluconacetobacter takamatsuzukensis]|uniref:DUF3325 domain-containing protein n=1 Tax=Gluconacetobacter takamatsuzukensis TaxID=1286190 RepID=A0A7W4KG09_9PROT|nr:hypothetical protein [Gluconacetobacter takamatsuzukensis]MBB2206281.1 hypothetical protein [Gluconacetobacter takamatsuzukensis]
MPLALILCGLAAAMLLAAGNERGRSALLGHAGTQATRRRTRLGGYVLLGVLLCLLIHAEGNLPFALVAWPLACGPALLVAALACTVLKRRRTNEVSSFSEEKEAKRL